MEKKKKKKASKMKRASKKPLTVNFIFDNKSVFQSVVSDGKTTSAMTVTKNGIVSQIQ